VDDMFAWASAELSNFRYKPYLIIAYAILCYNFLFTNSL
jgi:hypothetical protein